jgi:hypothetical protein
MTSPASWSDIDLSSEASLLTTTNLVALADRVERARERQWLVRGGVLGAGLASLVWLVAWPLQAWFRPEPEPVPMIAQAEQPAPIAPTPVAPQQSPVTIAVPPVACPMPPKSPRKAVAVDRAAAPVVLAVPPVQLQQLDTSESRIKVYLQLHQHAQDAWSRGDTTAAIDGARLLRERYPEGALFAEAVVIEARALAKAGRTIELRSLLEVMSNHPRLADKQRVLDQLAPSNQNEDGDQ